MSYEDSYKVFWTYQNTTQGTKIRINRQKKSITAEDMKNNKDPKPGRAQLYEMEMSLFVHNSGMKPGDLKSVHTEVIEKPSSKEAISHARKMKDGAESFTVSKSACGVDKEIFNDTMQNSAFGKNTQKLLDNTPVE